MARKLIEFDSCGLRFRTKQLGAVDAFRMLKNESDVMAALETLELMGESGHYIPLSSPVSVNEHVKDKQGILPAFVVLEQILAAWESVQLEPMRGWKPVKPGRHLRSKSDRVELPHVDPIISALIDEKLATLQQLEEYYSMSDALLMFDVHMKGAIDKAEAQYQALQDAKSKKKPF